MTNQTNQEPSSEAAIRVEQQRRTARSINEQASALQAKHTPQPTPPSHTRWDGAKITAGGFHAVDCSCEGCKALANQPTPQPQGANWQGWTIRLKAELDLARQQRDELLAKYDHAVRQFGAVRDRLEMVEQQRDELRQQVDKLVLILSDALNEPMAVWEAAAEAAIARAEEGH